MKRVAIFGTHGAAKTTLVYKLAAYYKMNDKNVTVIHETARQSPFPINTDVVYQTTLFVVTAQLQKELKAEAEGFEIAISDRTPSDAFIYIDHLKRGNSLTQALKEYCFEWLKQYDVLIYLEPTEGYAITADGVRASDQAYQLAIRDDFRVLVNEIKQRFNDKIRIIKAESCQVFDENQCNELISETNRGIYEQTRHFSMV